MHDLQKRLLQLIQSEELNILKPRKIAELLGETIHPQRIKHHLEQLAKKGLVVIDYVSGRVKKSTMALNKTTKLLSIPILGNANCGPATMIAEEDLQGYLKISERLLKRKDGYIAIRAIGDSMNKAAVGDSRQTIENGDYVIIDCKDKTLKDNDYVLSVIDGLANIKRVSFDKASKNIILKSESTHEYPPIFIHKDDSDFFINGKIVEVMKYPASKRDKSS
jgi:repressor LexA